MVSPEALSLHAAANFRTHSPGLDRDRGLSGEIWLKLSLEDQNDLVIAQSLLGSIGLGDAAVTPEH